MQINIGRKIGQSKHWRCTLYLKQTTRYRQTGGSKSCDRKDHQFLTGILRSGQIGLGGYSCSWTNYGNTPISADCRGKGDCLLQTFPHQHYGFSSIRQSYLTAEIISYKITTFFYFSLLKGDYYNSQHRNGEKYLHGVRGGRVKRHQSGRCGFPNGGGGGYQHGPSNSDQGFNCLFCQINSHPTAECRQMQTTRTNFQRGSHRDSSRGANRGTRQGGNHGGAFSTTTKVKLNLLRC